VSEPERPSGSVELLKEVVAVMREQGVRRVRIVRGSLELEAELDPASQFLGKEEPPEDAEAAAKAAAEKLAKGLCASKGCPSKSGHLGSPHCRQHFLAEMNGAETT
jgi:ABC-type cobalamin transport system ATPase subunit